MAGGEAVMLTKVVESGYLNDGDLTDALAHLLAEKLGVPYAVAVTSGTAAIACALFALGVGAGDEVLVPDVTFIATANAVTLTGARAVIVDVEPASLSMDPVAARRAITARTKAILPVHVSGRAGNLASILDLARGKGLPVVEDAAEALGVVAQGKPLGTHGELGCFSFSPNKTITTGQGGLVVTRDPRLARRLRELKDQGRAERGTGGDDAHPVLGFNFKLTNLQAAVGLAQLQDLDRRMQRMKIIGEVYRRELRGMPGIQTFPADLVGGEIPQWTDVLVERRDELVEYLIQHGMQCRKFWHPLHAHSPYQGSDSEFPVSSALVPKAFWLPSAFQMGEEEVLQVCSHIKEFYRKL
jgi:perosamine synthetase